MRRDVEDENPWDSLSVLPAGLYNTMVRPLLWRVSDIRSASARHAIAGLEAPLWVTGYFLAAIGAFMFRRRVSVIGFPVIFLLAVAFSGAVSHGNLGTAFRHRGQVMFAIAVLAMAGLEAVADRRFPIGRQDAGGVSSNRQVVQGNQPRKLRAQ